MSRDDAGTEVMFHYLESGWQFKTVTMTVSEVQAMLDGATVVHSNFGGWGEATLGGLVLRLKDGRKCELTEEHEASYEGSSEGWISIYIDEEW